MLGATAHWRKTPLPASALFSSGKVQTILPRSITLIIAQRPKHPPTFTHHRRQGHSGQVAFACNIARPQPGKRLGNGHPAPTGHPCQPTPLDLPAPRQANQSPGSALRRGAAAGGDGQARLPDRTVHRPNVTCAGDIPRQATCPSSQTLSFHLRPTARASAAPRSAAERPQVEAQVGR